MAEEDSSQEKTEEPTAKKLEKSRDDGQVARSKELNTLLILVTGSMGLLIFGSRFFEGGLDLFRYNMMLNRSILYDDQQLGLHLVKSGLDAARVSLPFFGVVLLAALLGPISMGGWLMSGKAMAPKMSRMSFAKGLKRMFSVQALMELLKALGKFSVVAISAVLILLMFMPKLQLLGAQSPDVAVPIAANMAVLAFLLMSLSIMIIAAIDIPFQIYDHNEKLKMTRQEVKDEMKNTEGKPEVKARIRQLQQEMAQGRMMSEVPDADVIITNPTHFAVALKYDPDSMASPMLVAKGADTVAGMIREVGKANNVTIVEYPLLARSIFYTTEINQFVPQGLYVAVAQILAYVFQLKQYRKGQGSAPKNIGDLDIPKEFVDLVNLKQT